VAGIGFGCRHKQGSRDTDADGAANEDADAADGTTADADAADGTAADGLRAAGATWLRVRHEREYDVRRARGNEGEVKQNRIMKPFNS